jgi:hypothetical protein
MFDFGKLTGYDGPQNELLHSLPATDGPFEIVINDPLYVDLSCNGQTARAKIWHVSRSILPRAAVQASQIAVFLDYTGKVDMPSVRPFNFIPIDAFLSGFGTFVDTNGTAHEYTVSAVKL